MIRKAEKINAKQDRGFSKKIDILPSEIIRDWRQDVSQIGPRMKATMSGAPSKSNFLRTYPAIPKIIIITTSMTLLLRL
jgi:hypothetical protein